MAEQPTDEQKMAAAREALEALDPPVTESIIGDRLVDATVAIVWSQLALVPPAIAAAPAPDAPLALFFQTMRTRNPELMAEVDALNAQHQALAARIAADNLANAPVPAPTG